MDCRRDRVQSCFNPQALELFMWKLLFPGDFPRYAIIAVWVALSLGSGLWLVIGAARYWGVAKEAADWAQAAGGLLAVFAALYAVADQRSRERRARAEQSAIVVKFVQVTATRAVELMLKLHFEIRAMDELEQQGPREGMSESAGNALAAIRSVDLMGLPRAEMIEQVVIVTRCLESVLLIYELKQSSDGDRSGTLYDKAREALGQISQW